MKKMLFAIFLIFGASLFVCAQTIDLRVKNVEVTTKYASVIKTLGKPLSKKTGGTFPCEDGPVMTLRYPGLELTLIKSNEDNSFFVAKMEVTSARWTVSGVRVGATPRAIQKRFGVVKESTKNGIKTLPYFITDGYADFFLQRGRVVKIAAEFNPC